MNRDRVCGFPILPDQKTYDFTLGVSNPIGQAQSSLLVDITQRGKTYDLQRGKYVFPTCCLLVLGLKSSDMVYFSLFSLIVARLLPYSII